MIANGDRGSGLSAAASLTTRITPLSCTPFSQLKEKEVGHPPPTTRMALFCVRFRISSLYTK